MARRPRRARPNERYEGYDSKFEYDLHHSILSQWQFHGRKIPYITEKEYHPDFFRKIGDIEYLIESKGRFWTSDEAAKYVWIKKCLKKNQILVFLFADPEKPMPNSKVRKDGTKRTHREWATDNGFKWYSAETFPKEWQ